MRSYILFFLFFQCLAWTYFFQDLSTAYIRKWIDILRIIQWDTISEEKFNIIEKAPAEDVLILKDNGTFTWFYASGNTLEGTWYYDGLSSIVQLQHSEFKQTYTIESMIDDNLLILKASGKQEYHILAENSPNSLLDKYQKSTSVY